MFKYYSMDSIEQRLFDSGMAGVNKNHVATELIFDKKRTKKLQHQKSLTGEQGDLCKNWGAKFLEKAERKTMDYGCQTHKFLNSEKKYSEFVIGQHHHRRTLGIEKNSADNEVMGGNNNYEKFLKTVWWRNLTIQTDEKQKVQDEPSTNRTNRTNSISTEEPPLRKLSEEFDFCRCCGFPVERLCSDFTLERDLLLTTPRSV